MSKKALTWGIVVSAILWSMSAAFVVAPLTAKAATTLVAGDLIRGTVKSPYGGYPVFYYGADGKKSLFSTEATYKTWYSDFSKVKVLPQSELESIPGADKNVTYRPGVHVVKFESESNLYVVEKGAKIRKISDAVAKEIYGASYVASLIQSAFRANYTAGTDVTVAADYNKAAAMAASPDISTDMGGSPVVTPVGAMTVSLASDNPAGAVLPQKAAGVTLMKVNLSSSSGGTVTGLNVKRAGVGSASDFLNLYLYDGARRLTTGRTIQSTTNEAQFTNLNVSVAAGGTKTLTLVGDVASTTQNSTISGDTHGFSVVSVASTAAVSGTPVTGSTFSIGSQAVSTVTATKGSTPSNPTVGTKGATISEFKLQAGTNDAEIRRIALIQSGTIPNGDLSNLELWQGGAKIAAVAALDGDKMRFNLDAPMTIPQGSTRVFNVKADVSGYGSRTINTYIEYPTDVYAVDKTYNFGTFVDIGTAHTGGSSSGTFDGASSGTQYITVTTQGGKATVAFNGPSAADVSVGTQDVVMYKFSLTAGDQALDVRNLRVQLDASNNTADDGTDGHSTAYMAEGGTNYITDIALKNMDTGARIDTKEITCTGSVTSTSSCAIVYNNSFIVPAGKTSNYAVTADMKNTTDTNFVGENMKVTLKAFSLGDVKEVNTNQSVALADIVPSGTSDIAGYNMTVKASALTVQLASTPVSGTVVKGAKNADMVGFSFAAGTQSDVKVTSITLTGMGALDEDSSGAIDTNAAADLVKVVQSMTLWVDGVQVGTSKSPDSSAGTLTFDNLNWTIPAGQTKKLVVKGDAATSITGLASVSAKAWVGIATAAGISAQDKDSNTVTPTDGDSTWSGPVNSITGTFLTVANAGTLAAALDGDTAKAGIIVGGSTDVPMLKVKFTPSDDSFLIKKVRIINDSSDDDTGISQIKLTYPTAAGTMETKTAVLSSGVADVSDLNFYAPVNKNSVLSVSADLTNIDVSGVSGDTPMFSFDFDSNFEAVGAGSGTTVTSVGAANIDGKVMTVRKTKPTVTLAANSPSGASVPGINEVLRYTISADAKGDVIWDGAVFKVTTTDNGSTDWDLGDDATGNLDTAAAYTLYDASDLTTALEAGNGDWTVYGAAASDAGISAGETVGYVRLILTTPITIAAGTSKTFVLKADTTGASTASDDTVRFDIMDEGSSVNTTVAALSEFQWDETGAGAATDITGSGVKNLPLIGGTIVY